MQDRIHFLEGLSLKDLAIIYQSAKLFVYPSIYEGFGIPIIEAIYSKIPVITNKNGVFSEAGGEFSYYLEDVYDVAEMKNLIEQIMKYPDAERIEKSHRWVQKFNDVVIADHWYNLYQNLMKK